MRTWWTVTTDRWPWCSVEHQAVVPARGTRTLLRRDRGLPAAWEASWTGEQNPCHLQHTHTHTHTHSLHVNFTTVLKLEQGCLQYRPKNSAMKNTLFKCRRWNNCIWFTEKLQLQVLLSTLQLYRQNSTIKTRHCKSILPIYQTQSAPLCRQPLSFS